MNKKIMKRVYYALNIVLASPVNVSNGLNEETDKDLLVNANGEVFIPGTSIAGALRSRITKTNNLRNNLAGFSDGEAGRMSSLFISDLYLKEYVKSNRDGVRLNNDKAVDNKFDMQIVETGAHGTMYLNYVVRDESENEFNNAIEQLITGIHEGHIRFGSNKNRGFGKLEITSIYKKSFTKDDIDEYINFDSKNIENYGTEIKYKDWRINVKEHTQDFVKILVPLELTGGISIRKYSARPLEADYEQLTINIKDENGNRIPVIPGTGISGVISADVRKLLCELGVPNSADRIRTWFGYIKGENRYDANNSYESLVSFGESKIYNSRPLKMTRNKVNRFDASTIDGALYTELSYVGGQTTLEIMVKKDEDRYYKAFIGILQIAIKDLQNGFIAVGGQTAVGRGLFVANGNVEYSEGSEQYYSKALYEFLEESIWK